jgi:hypothetical protein
MIKTIYIFNNYSIKIFDFPKKEPTCTKIEFKMTAQQVQPVLINTMTPLENRVKALVSAQKHALLRFIQEEIAVLKENWDGYGGAPIEKNVLNNSIFLINNLPNNLINYLQKENILPNANGTISFEWIKNTHELFLEIGNNYSTYYIKNNGQINKINNQFIMSNSSELRQFIKDLKSCLIQ